MAIKYYMSLDNLVEVTGETEEERFEKAKAKFLELLRSNNEIYIVCVDESEDS